MQTISRNLIAIFVAFFSGALAWIYGGTRSDYLVSFMPWMVVITAELMLCFPQRHGYETQVEARERVWKSIKKDPIFYLIAAFLVMLLLAFVNRGFCISCDYPAVLDKVMPFGSETCRICHQSVNVGAHEACFEIGALPFTKYLPSCVNVMQHYQVTMWFFAAFTMFLAVRHSLNKAGKQVVLEILVWNGVVLALLGFIQELSGAPGPLWATLENGRKAGDFFSTFGYPNMAGDYFTTMFALAIALWRTRYVDVMEKSARDDVSKTGRKGPRKLFWNVNYHLIAAAIFYFAALNTLSRAAILLVTTLAVILFIHSFIAILHNRSRVVKFKAAFFGVIGLILVVASVVKFMPQDIRREVNTLDDVTILDRVSGRGQYHARVSMEIWKDYPVFGCGGWGYKHLCIPRMTEEELHNIQAVGGINVHNDYLQFLAEHGAAGFLCLMMIILWTLKEIFAVWKREANAARFMTKQKRPASPIAIFALPAGAFAALLAIFATMIHALGDCPLRSPAVLSLFFITLAAIDGFLPKSSASKEH